MKPSNPTGFVLKTLLSLMLTCGTIGSLLLGIRAAGAQDIGAKPSETKAVVELFTSQGCSSCPPADALFGKLSKRSDILALTMPVDYWDYLGWKDTLASPAYTARQKAYARARGDGQVYTPQAVINGQIHVNGSSESQIDAALKKTVSAPRVVLSGRGDKDAIVIEAATASGATPAQVQSTKGTLLLAVVQRQADVAIGRGENHGRKVTYYNVVRQLKTIGEWTGGPLTVRVPRSEISRDGADFLAVVLQQGASGPILAAAEIKMP
jgi:hypothetical protein